MAYSRISGETAQECTFLKTFSSYSDVQTELELGTTKDTFTFFALMPSFTVTKTPGIFSNHLNGKCDEIILRKKFNQHFIKDYTIKLILIRPINSDFFFF